MAKFNGKKNRKNNLLMKKKSLVLDRIFIFCQIMGNRRKSNAFVSFLFYFLGAGVLNLGCEYPQGYSGNPKGYVH
jgi:hypothetical protein